MFPAAPARVYGPAVQTSAARYRPSVRSAAVEPLAPLSSATVNEAALRRPSPGPLFRWVKLASWFELGLFTALLVFWIAPGFDRETFIFGLSHGIGYISLCILILIAVLRHEAPYWLLAATLTPVGPVGSVIAIAVIERREPPEKEGIDTTAPEGG
jgi:hypothetical protein